MAKKKVGLESWLIRFGGVTRSTPDRRTSNYIRPNGLEQIVRSYAGLVTNASVTPVTFGCNLRFWSVCYWFGVGFVGVTGVFSGAHSNPNQDAITRKGSIRNTFTCQRPFGKGRSQAELEERRGVGY